MQRLLIKVFISTVLSFLLTISYLFLPQKVISLDNQLRDFLFMWRGELPKNNNIIIIDIDEKSLAEIGQWPWRRDKVSLLLEKIASHNPGIIGLDIVFAEPDRSSPHLIAQEYPDINITLLNTDKKLAQSFASLPIVGGYIFSFDKNKQYINPPILPAIFIANVNNSLFKAHSLTLNIPLLQESLYSSGFFNNIPDENGMIRSVPLVMEYDKMQFSSLALEMVRIYSGAKQVEIIDTGEQSAKIKLGEFSIPIDNLGRFFVNFRGPKKHYKYISATDIIHDKVNPSLLTNKFVLIGTSALGLYDLRSTTYDSNIPGVEIHANTIDNLLTGDYIYSPANRVLNDILIIWSVVFFTILLFHISPSWFIPLLFIGVLSLLIYSAYSLLFKYGIILNLLFPFFAYIFTLLISTGVDYYISQKEKEETRKILGKKVSIGVMDYLVKHKKENLVSPREVEASILFSDIQGFTTISEKIGSPNKLINILNSYMTPMVDNIISHQGTIDKFIGDAIMAYWNAPLPVKNHADEAVRSAVEQLELLVEVNRSIKKEYNVEIAISIGVHTGLVTAGDMGSEGRSDYTIIGDNVNLASRLEGLTRYYDVNILISKETYKRLIQTYTIRPIDIVEVKGKNKAVEIFEVIPKTKKIEYTEMKMYIKALNLFRDASLTEAKSYFIKLNNQNPNKLYNQYIKRCQYYIDNPNIPFTSVLKMTTK